MRMKESQYWSKKYPVRTQGVHPFAKAAWKFLKKRQGALLDLGCGYGDDAFYFARRGWTVTAVDFSAESMRKLGVRAKAKKIRLVAIQRDISKRLPFPDRSFDVVYAHLALHYFDDKTTTRMFRDIHRVLRKGGLFFVKCKSVDDPLYGKGKKIGPDTFKADHVRHFFSAEYLRKKLEKFTTLRLRKSAGIYDEHTSAFVEAVAQKN